MISVNRPLQLQLSSEMRKWGNEQTQKQITHIQPKWLWICKTICVTFSIYFMLPTTQDLNSQFIFSFCFATAAAASLLARLLVEFFKSKIKRKKIVMQTNSLRIRYVKSHKPFSIAKLNNISMNFSMRWYWWMFRHFMQYANWNLICTVAQARGSFQAKYDFLLC